MPSSVNPHAPASFNASMSTSSWPFNEREIAAAWKIRISSLEARARLSFRVSVLSTVGDVFAIQITVVNPPFADAFAPVWISSLYVNPGSRKCTCVSMSPGPTTSPPASRISSESSEISGAILAIFPFFTSISICSDRPDAGSTTSPCLMIMINFLLKNLMLKYSKYYKCSIMYWKWACQLRDMEQES